MKRAGGTQTACDAPVPACAQSGKETPCVFPEETNPFKTM